MPRPISWQKRLTEMHRQVRDSEHTPYVREEIERLFGVKGEAARQLVQLMPRFEHANAHVVEREALLGFLAAAIDAEDLRAHLDELRKNPPKASRRKIRLHVPGNHTPGTLQPLTPFGIWMQRGKLAMDFTTFDDFCSKMKLLVESIEDPAFERRYCEPAPAKTQEESEARLESKRIRAENKYLVRVAAAQQAMKIGDLGSAEILRTEAEATLADVQRMAAELGTGIDDVIQRAEAMLAQLFPAAAAVPAPPPANPDPPPEQSASPAASD